MSSKPGTVKAAKLKKAACGVRYDPDSLGTETGFDFSEAANFLDQIDGTDSEEKIHKNDSPDQNTKSSQ